MTRARTSIGLAFTRRVQAGSYRLTVEVADDGGAWLVIDRRRLGPHVRPVLIVPLAPSEVDALAGAFYEAADLLEEQLEEQGEEPA